MIIKAILKINPNAVVTVRGSDINTCEIEWLEGTTPISKADIEAKMAELPTAEEEAAQKETDFYALSDVTMSSEMETYRQELRDITEGLTTVEDVEAVVFPTKP